MLDDSKYHDYSRPLRLSEFVEEGVETEGEHVHSEEEGEAKVPFGTPTFWLYVGISFGLTCFAGLMSGLTVGLLSID